MNTTDTELASYATYTTSNVSFDVNLGHRALFSVPDASGLDITCESGTVWITLDNDTRDIVLEAAHTFTTPEHSQAIIYAMEPSKLLIADRASMAGARPAFSRQRVPSLNFGWGAKALTA